MDVYVAPHGKVFHVDADCPLLVKLSGSVDAVDVLTLRTPRPCRVCLPDIPSQDRYHRPYCFPCGSSRPCRHNGGVMVYEDQIVRVSRGTLRAGDVVTKTRWVWPDSPVLLAKHLAPVVE